MKYTFFDTKSNTLYIRGEVLFPDTKGMSFKEHCKRYDEAFKMPYEKRVELFAPIEAKQEIAEQLKTHSGCKISEFTYA